MLRKFLMKLNPHVLTVISLIIILALPILVGWAVSYLWILPPNYIVKITPSNSIIIWIIGVLSSGLSLAGASAVVFIYLRVLKVVKSFTKG